MKFLIIMTVVISASSSNAYAKVDCVKTSSGAGTICFTCTSSDGTSGHGCAILRTAPSAADLSMAKQTAEKDARKALADILIRNQN